jgi:hypothetical protein
VGISGRELGTRKWEMRCMWWICFVSVYENKRMKPFEIVLRRSRGRKRKNGGGGKSN